MLSFLKARAAARKASTSVSPLPPGSEMTGSNKTAMPKTSRGAVIRDTSPASRLKSAPGIVEFTVNPKDASSSVKKESEAPKTMSGDDVAAINQDNTEKTHPNAKALEILKEEAQRVMKAAAVSYVDRSYVP